MNKKPTLLCILDGFGLNPDEKGNAIKLANTPTFNKLWNASPKTTLITHGKAVGLPEGQMGNSEVGHMHISAGRVINQWLVKIESSLTDQSAYEKPEYKNFIENTNGKIHILGLYSDGGVHSHSKHLILLVKHLAETTDKEIVLHLITDGRDCGPNQALKAIKSLEEEVKNYTKVTIATIQGRFFVMDRDQRKEKSQKAYDLLVRGNGEKFEKASDALEKQYESGITDEFIEPAVINPILMEEKDSLICFNFRSDRMRQIVSCLTQDEGFQGNDTPKVFEKKKTLCFANYNEAFNIPFLFKLDKISNSLGEVLSENNLTQLRMAETEKYPHVTFFFNVGSNKEFPNEKRIMVESPKDVKTYDEKPEMSALELTQKVIDEIEKDSADVYILNFANCDMVGHTGSINATIKAVETVDFCLDKVLKALQSKSGQALIIADHGNAEKMMDIESKAAYTAHTTFPVPMILFGREDLKLRSTQGSLKDVAPTLLQMLDINKPIDMTGSSLIA